MNVYLIVIIASLVASWLLGLLSDLLTSRAMRPEPPSDFADVFDPATYARSQEYARASMRFSCVTETFNTATIIVLILAGAFNWLDLAVRSPALSPIPTGLAYIGSLALASALMSMPFEAYHTFVLENRFGFNTTTLRTFLLDRLKGVLLTSVLGGVLAAGVLFFFHEAGALAWLWCWGFAVAATLILTYVAPTWILPLFNKFTPMEAGELRTAIEEYARKNGFELSGIFVMDGSKRSTKGNAFFTGLGKRRRIALFDTLIKEMTTEEIVAVLAHEVGHAKLGHIRKRLVTGIAKTGLIFWLMSLFLNSRGLFDAFGMEHMSVYAGLIFFFLLYTPISMILSVLSNLSSRRHEFQADAFASKTTDSGGAAMISALKKLSAQNLSNLTPHPLTVWLEYGHPPVIDRVRALRAPAPAP
ncbi:M48 family metallopeptidase [Pseudodesulfovibrio portus]|uniref:Peptidase M48 n=1 Tax=Pseudodesulfovibrio portus TaxID=231439 RepID=A0ABN6RYN3_9BACT|nr:M48 family metallopeptidase [Pseudodesulfovibrio portus]BDQ35108.1 peptidase M48 [Pseudodesulfovibrio portus]